MRPPGAPERSRPAKPAAAPPRRAVAEAHPAPETRREPPPRSPAERVVLAVLLFGLGLNVAALVTNPHPTRSDLLLGGTVLLAGVVLLALIELCRRGAPPTQV